MGNKWKVTKLSLRDINILVAEDDPSSSRLLKDYFSAKGANVICRETGSGALQAIEKYPFDLAIVDLRLPEKNGFVVTSQIRAKKEHSCLPVIAVSAFADQQNKLRSLQVGADAFFSKPLNLNELYLTVNNFIARYIRDRQKKLEALCYFNELGEKKLQRLGHSEKVENLCLELADFFGLNENREELQMAARLHDIGLLYNGEKDHAGIGADIVRTMGLSEKVAEMIEKHHDSFKKQLALREERFQIASNEILALAERAAEKYIEEPEEFKKDSENGFLSLELAKFIQRRLF